MLQPDGTDAESRQPGHGAAGSSTSGLAPTLGQQFSSGPLTPSPYCSPASPINMLDRGSESLLRRIWDGDDGAGHRITARSHTSNRPGSVHRQGPALPPLRDNITQRNRISASDQPAPTSFPSLHSLEVEIEKLRSMRHLYEPTVSRTSMDTSLALQQLNRIEVQHTLAPDEDPFRQRAISNVQGSMRFQNDSMKINTTALYPPLNPGSSIWSCYGSTSDARLSPYAPAVLQRNTNGFTSVNNIQTPLYRSRASSETAPHNPMEQVSAGRTSSSCPSYLQKLQQSAHIANTNIPKAFYPSVPSNASYFTPRQLQQQLQYPPTPSSRFQPMHAVLTANSPHIFTPPTVSSFQSRHSQPVQSPLASRFSSRYHGMHTESNASADHLAPEENAGLWLTNLPPDVTHHELLSSIRNIGRIWCSYINQPDFQQHVTAAAKVVFFQPRAALRLLHFASTQGLNIRGFRVKVTQNRIKTPAQPLLGNMSRVLIITGKSTFVNPESLVEYFTERFVFQIDQVRELVSLHGRAVVEFRFGSFRCQAQMGKLSLEKDRPDGFDKVEFGEDPCEVGETNSSLSVAMQRIAGIGL